MNSDTLKALLVVVAAAELTVSEELLRIEQLSSPDAAFAVVDASNHLTLAKVALKRAIEKETFANVTELATHTRRPNNG